MVTLPAVGGRRQPSGVERDLDRLVVIVEDVTERGGAPGHEHEPQDGAEGDEPPEDARPVTREIREQPHHAAPPRAGGPGGGRCRHLNATPPARPPASGMTGRTVR